MVEECIFCKIMQARLPAHIIFENSEVTCFLDHDPINAGHCLIVPKKHLTALELCSKELRLAIMDAAALMSQALKRVYSPDGISIMQNGGFFDEIGHLHLHVFPRYKDDGFGWKVSSNVELTPQLQQERKDLLIEALKF